ncbi:MAG: portal protein [Nitrospira sp.]|nr:portal protein [Nitrospira sp.]
MESDQHAISIIAEQEQLANARGNWERTWEEIAHRILPNYATQFWNRNRTPQSDGTQRLHEMVDSTGALALDRFSAAMDSMLTPRNSVWHSLVPSDHVLKRHREVRIWFEDLTRLLFAQRYAPTANFSSQKHEDYLMLGAFGTSCLFIDALQARIERGLRYRAIHIGQCFFTENHQGLIDTNYRKFPLTAQQAVTQFGREAVPDSIAKQAENPKQWGNIHYFVHKVAPRQDYDPERKDVQGMAFESLYVSVTGKQVVRAGGYHTFPYAISRYVTTPGELYGRSPAMLALPTIKSLNEMKKTMLKQGHRSVDPVLLAHDDASADNFSLRPGALNAGGVNADGKALVHALPVGNLAIGDKLMEGERVTINDFFLVSLFQILVETPQMTATEVVERAREKGALLAPTMGRQQSESLGPMIDREIDLLTQLQLIPPMPQILVEARGEYTIQYDSPLSRMARAEETAGLMRVVDYLKDVVSVTQNPEPLDHFDWDTIVPEMSDNQAVPMRWRKSLADVQALRASRAKQAEQQQMLDAAPAGAAMMKTLMPKQPQGMA